MYTHICRERLRERNFFYTCFKQFRPLHSSFHFLGIVDVFFTLLFLSVCTVTWFNFSSFSICFTKFLYMDWVICMRIVSIPFDLIFACFQNKVLSCMIRRQSFVLLLVFSYCQSAYTNKTHNLMKRETKFFHTASNSGTSPPQYLAAFRIFLHRVYVCALPEFEVSEWQSQSASRLLKL